MAVKTIGVDTSFIPETGATPFPGYELIRLRGQGGFAEVWESSTPDGERIALKFLSTQTTSATARELRALRAIHSLEHPHLLKTRHVWCIPGFIVIGMELAEATLLDMFLLYNDELRQPIEFDKLLCMIYQAALGLDFLNAHNHNFEGKTVGFQHGDIKPNNLMMIGEHIKVADYGLATPIQSSGTPCHRHGSMDYVAPEVMSGRLTDTSDQFGLAVTYVVLRVGSFPFPPPPPQEEILKSGINRPEPNLSLLPAIEQPIVKKALSVVPQLRYKTSTAFVRAIAQAYSLDFEYSHNPRSSVPVTLKPIRATQRIG